MYIQEKYGPKGQNKPLNVTTAKSNKDAKKQPDVDITVGLSERPPWFCRYVVLGALSDTRIMSELYYRVYINGDALFNVLKVNRWSLSSYLVSFLLGNFQNTSVSLIGSIYVV